jgi:hypothetical protein
MIMLRRSWSELQTIRLRDGEQAYQRALGVNDDDETAGAELGGYNFPAMRTWLDLLKVAKDHETVTKHVDAMEAATAKATNAQAALKAATDAHDEKVASDLKRLDEREAAFEKKCAAREAEIEQRDAKSRSDANELATRLSSAAHLESAWKDKWKRLHEAASQ